MMISFKVGFRNQLPVELEVENEILAVHIPTNREMVDMTSFLVFIVGRTDFSLVTSVEQARVDYSVTLKVMYKLLL